jgi:hypothetical protein
VIEGGLGPRAHLDDPIWAKFNADSSEGRQRDSRFIWPSRTGDDRRERCDERVAHGKQEQMAAPHVRELSGARIPVPWNRDTKSAGPCAAEELRCVRQRSRAFRSPARSMLQARPRRSVQAVVAVLPLRGDLHESLRSETLQVHAGGRWRHLSDSGELGARAFASVHQTVEHAGTRGLHRRGDRGRPATLPSRVRACEPPQRPRRESPHPLLQIVLRAESRSRRHWPPGACSIRSSCDRPPGAAMRSSPMA